jgi:Zn-finger nucleic acid-binding protein
MKCPVDGTTLLISNREGVEIDHCPTCRGVWLDRGELDKIIERTDPTAARQDVDDERPPKERRRESLIDLLFDFSV